MTEQAQGSNGPAPADLDAASPVGATRILRSRQSRTLTTRDTMLRAASTILGERGYEASSIDDVAQLAGVTKATVYYHFASKEELYAAVRISLLDSSTMLVGAAVQRCATPVGALATMVDMTISQTMDRQRRYVFFHELIIIRPELRRALAAAQQAYGEIGERIIADGQLAGDVIGGPPRMLVNIFLGTIARTSSWYRDSGAVPPAAFSALLRSIVLDGVLTEAGRRKLTRLVE